MVRSMSPTIQETNGLDVSESTKEPQQQNYHQGQQQIPQQQQQDLRAVASIRLEATTTPSSSSTSTSSSPVPNGDVLLNQRQGHQPPPPGLVIPPSLDPNQMYIVSGPFTCYGQTTMIAYPIPRGATVIATPSMRPMSIPPAPIPIIPSQFPAGPAQDFRTNPYPSPPVTPEPLQQQQQMVHGAMQQKSGFRTPSALIWNAYTCPEGRLMPLRQTQPPVYFYQNGVDDQHQQQQQYQHQQQHQQGAPQVA